MNDHRFLEWRAGELTGNQDPYKELKQSQPTVRELAPAGYVAKNPATGQRTPGLDMMQQNSGELRGQQRSEPERTAAFLREAAFMGIDPGPAQYDSKGNVANKYCDNCGSWESEEVFAGRLAGFFGKRLRVCKSCGRPWRMRPR